MVMSRLPLALLKTHTMITVRQVIITMNMTTLGKLSGVQTPLQNNGRCQQAQSRPRMMPPAKGPCSA
jgi:hypothetical protein